MWVPRRCWQKCDRRRPTVHLDVPSEQNRNFYLNGGRTKCQPDEMPTKGWHFVRTFFCGWHFVRPNFSLTFCPEHLNMFWPFVRIMKNVFMP